MRDSGVLSGVPIVAVPPSSLLAGRIDDDRFVIPDM